MKNHSIAVRSVTVAAAAALSLGVAAPIMPANAQTGVVRTDNGVRVSDGTIVTKDENGNAVTGTLTIFKRATKSTQEPTGEAISPVPGEALAGAGFTLYPVDGVNLTTNEGLAAASNLTVATASQKLGKAVADEKKTDGNGQAKWENLPLGVYLLKETTTPDGYSPAADSLVFVPMTRNNGANTDGGTQWLYDITAYPKNTPQQQPEKKVEDSGKNVGDTVTYTIDTWAQTVRDGQYRTIYRIEDTLDPALDAANATVTVAPNTFKAGTDYNVTKNDQKIVVEFTDAGVEKITDGQKISATITAKVKEGVLTDGALKNKATQIQNNPNSSQKTDEKPTDTPEVKTYYGKINFKKVDGGRKALKGAEFQVYGTNEATCSNADANKDARQKANGKDTWVSDQDGMVTIDGLHANNIANMDSKGNTTPNKYTKYCLFETKSPSGFELLAEPLEFTLTADTETNKVTASEIKVGNNAGEIVNLEDTTPKLPLTGGMGIGILAALGALIIAAGAYSAKRRSA